MSRLDALKEKLQEHIERERRNFNEARKLAGTNCPGAAMALGAADAYEQMLIDIEELEKDGGE